MFREQTNAPGLNMKCPVCGGKNEELERDFLLKIEECFIASMLTGVK